MTIDNDGNNTATTHYVHSIPVLGRRCYWRVTRAESGHRRRIILLVTSS